MDGPEGGLGWRVSESGRKSILSKKWHWSQLPTLRKQWSPPGPCLACTAPPKSGGGLCVRAALEVPRYNMEPTGGPQRPSAHRRPTAGDQPALGALGRGEVNRAGTHPAGGEGQVHAGKSFGVCFSRSTGTRQLMLRDSKWTVLAP